MDNAPKPKLPSWMVWALLVLGGGLVLLALLSLAGRIPKPGSPQPSPTASRTLAETAARATTALPTPTPTVSPTETGTPEPTATPTPTPEPTATPTPTPEPTATPTPTSEPTATPTLTPEPTATLTPEPTATLTPEPTATFTPTAMQAAVPTATRVPPTPAVTGWRGEYYANTDLAGAPALVRTDSAVGFSWEGDAPAPGLPADGFSVRWTRIASFAEGMYDFHATMDDGMRVYVDDELLIDEWQDQAQREVTASRHMSAGNHTLRVEYYDRQHIAVAQFWWEELRFYAGWKGMYWDNKDLVGNPVLVRDDPEINFNWGVDSPGPGVPEEQFSARWTRRLSLPEGTYSFWAYVDDGVRLWVDGQLLIDAWQDQQARMLKAEYVLGGTGEHEIEVEYYDNLVQALITVGWEWVADASYDHWMGEYFANPTLTGDPRVVRNDRSVDFDWDTGPPLPTLPADDFSVRWTRTREFESGTYRFYVRADDGIRLYVDDEEVLNEWHQTWGDTYQVDVTLSGEHDLKLEFYEGVGDARIKLWWESVGG